MAVALLAWGCAKPPAKAKRAAPPPKSTIPAQTVNLSPGSGTAYGEDKRTGQRTELWFIRWKQAAQAKLNSEAEFSEGKMDGVTGYLVERGHPATTFGADHGQGKRVPTPGTTKLRLAQLVLNGHVHMQSINRGPSGSLTAGKPSPIDLYCDRLVYDSIARQIRAQGHVRIVSRVGTIGPMPELWATPNLRTAATPDMFPSP